MHLCSNRLAVLSFWSTSGNLTQYAQKLNGLLPRDRKQHVSIITISSKYNISTYDFSSWISRAFRHPRGAMNCSSTMSKVSTGFWIITRLLFLTETLASEAPRKFVEDYNELCVVYLTLMCVEYDGCSLVSSNVDLWFVSTQQWAIT